jgi:hypothetical protein
MARAVVAGVVVLSLSLVGCSGGSSQANSLGPSPACPILAKLAQTGQSVAASEVADPPEFNATLRTAVAKYVRTAQGLRTTVPVNLRDDVDLMIAAAQQHRFTNALTARARIDRYARSECKTK